MAEQTSPRASTLSADNILVQDQEEPTPITTLQDILSAVHFLIIPLSLSPGIEGMGLKALRLVSKSVSRFAMLNATTCHARISSLAGARMHVFGEDIKDLHLQNLKVTVVLDSGIVGETRNEQLALFMDAHMHTMRMLKLIEEMGGAIQGIIRLDLRVQYICQHDGHILFDPPDSHAAVYEAVFSSLAVAVPSLQQMGITDCKSVEFLGMYRSLCPCLKSLFLNLVTLPKSTFARIAELIPDIVSISFQHETTSQRLCTGDAHDSLSSHSIDGSVAAPAFRGNSCLKTKIPKAPYYSWYARNSSLARKTRDAVDALTNFKKLTVLSFSFDLGTDIKFPGMKTFWEALPPGLEDLSLNCLVTPAAPDTHAHLQSLRHLTMICPTASVSSWVSSCTDLNTIMKPLPGLHQLTLCGSDSGHVVCLYCSGGQTAALLGMVAGLDLVCSNLMIRGEVEHIEAVLKRLPTLPATGSFSVFLHVTGNISVSLMGELARVFSHTKAMIFRNNFTSLLPLDETLLLPLAACKSIHKLVLQLHQIIKVSALFGLCKSLPSLAELQVGPCIEVDGADLQVQLQKLGRNIHITSYHSMMMHEGFLDIWKTPHYGNSLKNPQNIVLGEVDYGDV